MISVRRRPAAHRAIVALLAASLAGCGSTQATSSPPLRATPSDSPSPSIATVTSAPITAPPATPGPSPTAVVSCASRTLASMTEDQRIGQVFNVGLSKDVLDATERAGVAAYHFGSMWFPKQTSEGVTAVRAVADAVQAQATQAATHGVRFFVGANQEGGLIQGLSGPGFDVIPPALTQGAWSTSVLQTKALRWAGQLRAAGVNLNFAPVADVVPPGTDAQNAPIGQLKREFGHDPATVSSHVAAFFAGMDQAGVETAAKHFPGLGRVAGNTDFTGAVTDSVTTRHDAYLAPFAHAIDVGVPFVMVSLAIYERIDPANIAAFSTTIDSGMLRGDLGFRGVVVSDSLSAAAVSSLSPGTRAIDFIAAGGDMIVLNPLDQAIAMAKALAARAAASTSFRARVNNAALHVLEAKQAAGLLPC
jgi:beta-N-acetylhexosaminidase